MVERSQSNFAQLVGHDFGRARDQLAHVVETLCRVRRLPFGPQVVAVPDRVDQLAEQLIDRSL